MTTTTTVRIPKDKNKHRIVIPNEVWEAENLEVGNIIEISITNIYRKKVIG